MTKRSNRIRRFLSDDLTIQSLAHAADGQPRNTNADFETRTAAVNVTLSNDGRYDVKEIKDDATWLAGAATIDEVSALRIVILEWQDRAALRILQRYTKEEKISLEQAIGRVDVSNYGSPSYVGLFGEGSDASQFDSAESRHARLLRLSLSEQESTLGVKVIIAASEVERPLPSSGRASDDTTTREASLPWLQEVFKRISLRERRSSKGKGLQSVAELTPRENEADNAITQSVKDIVKRLQAYERGSGWTFDNMPELEDLFQVSQLTQAAYTLQLIFIRLSLSTEPESAAVVKSWFQFVDEHGFFAIFNPPSPRQQAIVEQMQMLLSIISLQIIKFRHSLDLLRTNQPGAHATIPILFDQECQKVVNSCLLRAADNEAVAASPAMLAWSILLQQLRNMTSLHQHDANSEEDLSLIEDRPSPLHEQTEGSTSRVFSDALQVILDTNIQEDPILYLAKSAVNSCQVFSAIAGTARLLQGVFDQVMVSEVLLYGNITLLDLVREGLLVALYSPEVLDVVLTLLGAPAAQSNLDIFDTTYVQEELGSTFSHDDEVLVPHLFEIAQQRYPYEFEPYMKLSKALSVLQTFNAEGNSRVLPLTEISRCTQALPRDFTGYELVREDENANFIRLTEDLPLFMEKRSQSFGFSLDPSSQSVALVCGSDGQDVSCIPRGTTGFVVNDQKPFVVTWEHPHSMLRYLSRVLSTAPINSNLVVIGGLDISARELQSDIIEFIACQISSTLKRSPNGPSSSEGNAAARKILEEASDSLGRNQDIVTLISTVFEEELSRQTQQRNEGSTELLVSCVHFFQAIMEVMPGRVWPLLARSDFLQPDGNDPKLPSIVASVEIPTGRFDLLLATIALFDGLCRDITTNAVQRKAPRSTNGRRFAENTNASTGLSEKVLSQVVIRLARIFLDVLQSSQEWTFALEAQRTQLSTAILQVFDNIIMQVYGFDDAKEITEKLTSALAPAAKHLVEAFVGTTSEMASSRALLQTCVTCTASCIKWTAAHGSRLELRPVQIPLHLLTTLLHVTTSNDTPSAQFEQQIFRFLPFVIRIYAADQSCRNDIVLLITALVDSAARTSIGPPSLLSQLGQENSINFLSIISNMSDTPLGDHELRNNIWNLCTTLVSGRQQWFATYLLTGETPKSSLKAYSGNESKTSHIRPLLSIALDILAKIKSTWGKIDKDQAIVMLKFVAAAQSQWHWVTDTIRKHPSFIVNIAEFVDNPKTLMSEAAVDASIISADQRHAASLIADVLAIFLYNSRHMGDVSNVKVISSRLSFFKEQGVSIPKYSSSLHVHLKKNFAQKFPGCEVGSFKRVLGTSTFGHDYYYDLDFAAKLLSKQQAWSGGKDGSFADEFVRANTNLSLVQSQVLLLISWKTLAIELSASLAGDVGLQKQLATVAHDCLVANAESNLPEVIFDQLLIKRADLALIILQRLVSAQSSASNVKGLLDTTWSTIRACGHDFDSAFSGATTEHYRILLKILLLAIQFHTFSPQSKSGSANGQAGPKASELSSQTASILLELVTSVVAKGFCSLATQLHEDPESIVPSDISLIIAIFKSVLRVTGVETVYSQIALRLSDSNATRYAIALFSWSDRFTAEDEDPIYGELSITFLCEMSNVPSMSEFLAAEGLLAQLNTANLMSDFRCTGGMGPLDAPQRLHAIWSRGLLPLCLNMLVAVGGSFAAEVTAFLNNFPEQLERTAECLDLKSSGGGNNIALNTAAELHNLSLIAMILERFRMSPTAAALGETPELAWDRASVKSDLETCVGGRRAALRERIVPVSEQEVLLSRQAPTDGGKGGECENRLEERVVAEMQGALRCLNVLSG